MLFESFFPLIPFSTAVLVRDCSQVLFTGVALDLTGSYLLTKSIVSVTSGETVIKRKKYPCVCVWVGE